MHVEGNLAAVKGWLEAPGDIADEVGCRELREARSEGLEEGLDRGGKGKRIRRTGTAERQESKHSGYVVRPFAK